MTWLPLLSLYTWQSLPPAQSVLEAHIHHGGTLTLTAALVITDVREKMVTGESLKKAFSIRGTRKVQESLSSRCSQQSVQCCLGHSSTEISSGNKHGKLLSYWNIGGALPLEHRWECGQSWAGISIHWIISLRSLKLLGKYITRRGICVPFTEKYYAFQNTLDF